MRLQLQKYDKPVHFIASLLLISAIAYAGNLFEVESKVINKEHLWDMEGRPYSEFLLELNLPGKVGAMFVAGSPDHVEKMGKVYTSNWGEIFTHQLGSLLGMEITVRSKAVYINYMFGIGTILFSILAGHFIFKNDYVSVILFIPMVIFRNFSQGLIYGIPNKYTFTVFYPSLAFCIIITIVLFLENPIKKYWAIFIPCGFIVAYIGHGRASEGMIVKVALLVIIVLMSLEYLMINKKYFNKLVFSLAALFIALAMGYIGYYQMIAEFMRERDSKFTFPEVSIKSHQFNPLYHLLYISTRRFEIPNRYGDKIGFDAVFERYPEYKKKFSTDTHFVRFSSSEEYNEAIKEILIENVLSKPGEFFEFLIKSVYDYILFLPYFSWTSVKSAHVFLPKINENVEIAPEDMAPFFQLHDWILNLKPGYLPQSLLFRLYFVLAYLLLAEAVFTAFVRFRRPSAAATLTGEVAEGSLPIYLLRGMLIYFFFASLVRILIPIGGHSVVVAFNMIIIYNLVRIAVSVTRKVEIPQIKLTAPSLSFVLIGLFLVLKNTYWPQIVKGNLIANGGFEDNANGWIAHKSKLYRLEEGQSGKSLQVVATFDSVPTYVYRAFPTEPGSVYSIRAYFKQGTNKSGGEIKVGTMIDKVDLYHSGLVNNTDWKLYVGIFRASSPISYLTLVNQSTKAGESSYFDSVSIIEVE